MSRDFFKKTLPKSMTIDSCKSVIITLIKSKICEPKCDWCMHDENPEHIDKYNESCESKEETKIVDGPEVNSCKELG